MTVGSYSATAYDDKLKPLLVDRVDKICEVR